ncbi:MAG: YigZ family protein [Rikenellaceae bacterium]
MVEDSFLTITDAVEVIYKLKSSKFLSYAYPISSEEEVAPLLDVLCKKYYDATHHCYAWRIGAKGEKFRANDDGEPSSTAGKPILGQMLSRQVTNCLVVVVRYFGGTKLGVSGLIEAYGDSAGEVLDAANIVERTVDVVLNVAFSYISMNGVMKAIKEMQPRITKQEFDNLCTMQLVIRVSESQMLIAKLEGVEGVTVEILE